MIRLRLDTDGESRLLSIARDRVEIGRTPDNDVVLSDTKLSRHHCRLFEARDGVWVQDLSSRNGTFVNGERVEEALVRPGDRIRVGSSEIFVLGDEGGRKTQALEEVRDRLLEELESQPRRRQRRPGSRRALELENRALRKLLEVVRNLARERSLNNLLFTIVDATLELTGAERGFLLLFEGEQPTFKVARHYLQEDILHPEFEISHSIAERVARTGRTFHARDALAEAGLQGMTSVIDLELRSLLCVPLRANRQTLGAVYVDHRAEAGAFSPAQVRLVEALAAQAAFAVRNMSLRSDLANARRRLNQTERRSAKLERRLRLESRSHSTTGPGELGDALDVRGELIALGSHVLVVSSPAMRRTIDSLERIAPARAPVALFGESGTGKELLAALLHRLDPARSGAFVPVDCSALPDALIEAELFGYTRGAFSGADRARPGLLQTAERGTIFLDRADEMSPALQAKLLRVLEEGKVRRLGAQRSEPLRARIVAATSTPLREAVAADRFREDLFYRLAVFEVGVPPLRERPEDIPELWRQFARAAVGDPEALKLEAAAERELMSHDWPGNVRELENLISQTAISGQRIVRRDEVRRYLRGFAAQPIRPLREAVEELERRLIAAALRRCDGNKSLTARQLGLSRPGLQKKMDRYGLETDAL